ncbi:hypothetical protein Gpo141_00012380 [Globisporangium polare]
MGVMLACRDLTPAFLELSATLSGGSKRANEKKTRSVHGSPSAFDMEATELTKSLVALEELLQEIRPKYLRPKHFIRVKGAKMSEQEKDEFDADFTELVKNCSAKIDALNDVTSFSRAPMAQVEHQKEVVTYLLERLKSIANATKRMQKRRYEQPFLLSSRLLPEDVRSELPALEDRLPKLAVEAKKPDNRPTPTIQAEHAKPTATPHEAASTSPLPPRAKPKPVVIQHTPVFVSSQEDKIEFSEDQDRRFRAENITLHRHFQENLEDAKNMESKMTEISSLMGQFADKIMEQQTDIEMIHQHATETKANVTQSNRILESAQNIGSGYGFMIFCFYAAFSVLLHVLHYFNN